MVVLRRFGLVAMLGVVAATVSGCGFDLLREDDFIVFRNDSRGFVYLLIESRGEVVRDVWAFPEESIDITPSSGECWEGPVRVLDDNRDEIARIDEELCAVDELVLHEDLTLTKGKRW